jgi:hypothetical protein
MFIVIFGDVMAGFTVAGPYHSDGAARAAADCEQLHSGTCDYDVLELESPCVGADPNGTAVVFGGDITDGPFLFYGPFTDIAAARAWAGADTLGSDCAIELMRFESELDRGPAPEPMLPFTD